VNADTQQVIVNALPVIAFTGLDTAYCVDAGIVTLAGNIPAGTFDGAGIAGNRFIPAVASAGSHTIIFSFTDFNGCFNADTQQTNVYDLPIVSMSGLNTNYCSNDALVTLSGNPVGGNFSGTGITGNNFSPEMASAGFHILTYTFTDNNNCTNSISENTTVYAAPTVQEQIQNISCYNAADGTITLTSLDGTGPFNYNWNNGTYTTQNISGLSPGNYTIVIDDAMNCTFTATYTVIEPDLLVSSVATENAVCYLDENGSAVFTVNGGVSPYSFNWNNGLNVAENYSLFAGNYSVLITDANGCANSHQFIIAQNEPVTLSVFPEIDTVAFGNEVQTITEYYSGQMPVSFDWQPTEGLSCADCANPIAAPLETTLYTVTMTDADGCTVTEEIWVVVKDKKVFYAPNMFSPNGDGVNDNFEIFVKGAKKFHLRIFNRWGEKVFEAEDAAQVWDGTRNGKLLSEGVYIFEVFLIYKDNTSLKHKGSVTLVR
jgi:gliding motility-associated-like protein